MYVFDNLLTGTIPIELDDLVPNASLAVLGADGNNLSGTISDVLCSLGLLDENNTVGSTGMGLSFDCSPHLCGCEWCPCGDLESDPNTTEGNVTGTGQ